MNPNLDHKQIVKGIVEARVTSFWDGWLIFVEAMLIGFGIFKWWDNALVGLAGFVLALGLLSQKAIGTLASLALGGISGWWAGHLAYLKSGRWDIGVAAGLVAGFFAFAMHQGHVQAFEKY